MNIWIVATSSSVGATGGWEVLAPAPPDGQLASALGLGLLVVALVVGMSLLERLKRRFRPQGRLFDWLTVTQGSMRAVALFVIGSLFLTALPQRFSHLMPWLLLAAALGAGFTLRHVAGSLLAWVVLLSEGRIRPGIWLEVDGRKGVVQRLGPRVLWLTDKRGDTLAIPNQKVLHHSTLIDNHPWPTVTLEVRVPDGIAEHEIAERLREATLTSPWVTPWTDVLCAPVPGRPNHWSVETRVLSAAMRSELAAHLPLRLAPPEES